MATPAEASTLNRDPRTLQILAKSIYRELLGNGYGEEDVMRLAAELLDIVAAEARERRAQR